MRLNAAASALCVAVACLAAGGAPALAKTNPQSQHCAASASRQGLAGAKRTAFLSTCMKGPLAAKTPTAPTAPTKESQAVTKPSGVDRTTRTKQCAAEADRKRLSGKARSQFQLSCLATAGPVSEGETGTQEPHPAHQIKGIGVNNYKPDAAAAASKPASDAPAPVKPHS